ncbi:MAG TPA: Zn-ribbon domain-containing OB-fold protein [Steroidobacteraceae bacterium]|nr:Zn-ribbon domain-containing OB-fold protein [Steroidobacteraceae bacterium]
MSGTTRNLPVPTKASAEYWDACRRHELLIQRCTGCTKLQFYPRLVCASCSENSLQWIRASGRATLTTYTIVRRPVSRAYAAEVPYVVALVALEEGPTMMTHVIDCDIGEVRIGMSLEVVFDDWPEGVTVPKFRPAGAPRKAQAT